MSIIILFYINLIKIIINSLCINFDFLLFHSFFKILLNFLFHLEKKSFFYKILCFFYMATRRAI